MTRTNSKHGLEHKFKPWRKGKGKGSGSGTKSSLKNQLRSQTRLLQKAKATATGNDDKNNLEQIQMKINKLQQQIDLKSHAEVQRKYATK